MMKTRVKVDYTKVCWSCRQPSMVEATGGAYWRCTSCGATWNDTPDVSNHTLQNTWVDEKGYKHWHPIGIAD